MKKILFLFFAFASLALSAQTSDYCNFTLYLKSETGSAITGQKFQLFDSQNKFIVELITDQQGKSTVKVKKNASYFFETSLNNRTMRTEIPLGTEDNVSFKLQLNVAKSAAIEDVKVNFHVTDDKGVAETEAKIIILTGTDTLYHVITDVEGNYKVNLKKKVDYTVYVQKFGKTFNLDFDLPDDPDLTEFTYNVKIKVIESYVRTFVLDNVYFDVNKWDIKPECVPALSTLYDMLVSNPSMTIEVGGHTDKDGDDASNMVLSQRRADAVKQYIVNKGIKANRILAKGYGEVVPIATNDKPEGKAKNRRTEIKVISE
jgi:outer membrane protein OmpA-like peptidoglycan-associated protein